MVDLFIVDDDFSFLSWNYMFHDINANEADGNGGCAIYTTIVLLLLKIWCLMEHNTRIRL